MSCRGTRLGRATLFAFALIVGVHVSPRSGAEHPGRLPIGPAGEGEGPFERLILRGVTLIDGTGAPPQGPVDIVIARNRILEVRSVGYPNLPIRPDARPGGATQGDRRHRHVRHARLHRLPRAHRRRPQGP